MIPIKTVARERIIRQRRNLLRELGHLTEGVFKAFLIQPPSATRNLDGLFQQARGIRLNRATLRRSLSGEFCLNLRSDVNRDRHPSILTPNTHHPRRPLAPLHQHQSREIPLLPHIHAQKYTGPVIATSYIGPPWA